MDNNFPPRFAILTGKSCERSVITSHLKKVIKIVNSINEADQNKYVFYTKAKEFNSSTATMAFLIFDEEESLDVTDDTPLYFALYNSDRVHLVRHTLFIKSEDNMASYIQRIKDTPINVCEYPDTNIKECGAIIFKTIPTVSEYYEYIRTITSRSNYKDRAKLGVSVDVYFLVTPSNVNLYNNMVSKIVKLDERYKQLKKKVSHSISYTNGKISISPLELKSNTNSN